MSERKSKADGLQATNRDYLDYDQVEKRQSYAFAEQASEEFDDDFVIRTLDLGRFLHGDAEERAAFATELGSALREIGFAILTGHGVDPELYARCEAEVVRVFTEHTPAEKLHFRAARHGSVNQGYFPIEETSDIHPDQVEGWVFCRRAFGLDGDAHLPEFWPDARHERVFRELVRAHEALIEPVMQALLGGLGCDPHLFDERLNGTNLAVRLNHYPPLRAEAAGAGRLLGHEDVDLFTLLPAPRTEGLQVLNRANFRWVRLDAPPGSIVLNTGDYVQRLSNDIYPSTTHRVSAPRDPALRDETRVSFPTNVYLWEDELLEVLPGLGEPKYAPVRAEDFHTRTTAKYYGDDYADSPASPTSPE